MADGDAVKVHPLVQKELQLICLHPEVGAVGGDVDSRLPLRPSPSDEGFLLGFRHLGLATRELDGARVDSGAVNPFLNLSGAEVSELVDGRFPHEGPDGVLFGLHPVFSDLDFSVEARAEDDVNVRCLGCFGVEGRPGTPRRRRRFNESMATVISAFMQQRNGFLKHEFTALRGHRLFFGG